MVSLRLPEADGTCITALYVGNRSVWVMSGDARSLDDVRAEIDAIDAQMRDLVVRRMALISEVSAAKQRTGSAALHPSREATIMRNLVQQHAGPPSPAILLRIWREIINSATAMQGAMSVAVCAPEKSVGYWDMARNHFGTDTPMTLPAASAWMIAWMQRQAAPTTTRQPGHPGVDSSDILDHDRGDG